ncbi:MAG: porin [Pseudomonadota bacterium]
MKRKLLPALILASLAGAASAQTGSQISIYGLVDSGVEYVNNVNAAGDSVVRVPSLTGSFPSRIGFRGAEDLGNGSSAIFQLESGFGLDTGVSGQGGRLFGRQSWVGLKGSYGSLTIGRQYNMSFHSLVKADVMGPSIHALTNMDSYLPNARSDNSLAYIGNFGGVVLGASHSFGRDASPAGAAGPSATNCAGEAAADARACRQQTALLGYDTQRWGVYTSWDKQYGNTGATNGLSSSAHSDRRVAVSGYALAGEVKIGAGWMRRDTVNAAPSASDLYFIGASLPLGQWTYDAQYAALDVRDAPAKSALITARATYALSKRSALYASCGHIRNRGGAAIAVDAGGTVGKGMNQSGLMTGIRHTF